ncbi:MAG: SDR family NAD(P)-dependent oxidoreductase [Candidatus Aminicenantaceae bacterium]
MPSFESRESRGILKNKVALITGGSSGIGKAIALLFAREGAAISIADLNHTKGKAVAQTAREAGGDAIFVPCDVTCSEDCKRAVEQTASTFERLDILVNNTGIIRRSSVPETSEKEWDQVMAVNVKSVFLLSKFAIPYMERRGSGAIINIASGWGLVGGTKAASYCASKGAVVLLTKAMALDHGEHNIRVNCICPGDVDTPLLSSEAEQLGEPIKQFLEKAAQRPLKRIGKPEEIAQAALYLASDSSSYITGISLIVDGGGLAG